jgi:ProP effector
MYQRNRQHLELLIARFPKCFVLQGWRRQPLKVGAALDGALTPYEVRAALFFYTSDRHYRARLCVGFDRVDLDGKPAGTVTEEQVAHLRRGAATIEVKPPAPPQAEAKPEKPARLSLADLRQAAKRRSARKTVLPSYTVDLETGLEIIAAVIDANAKGG